MAFSGQNSRRLKHVIVGALRSDRQLGRREKAAGKREKGGLKRHPASGERAARNYSISAGCSRTETGTQILKSASLIQGRDLSTEERGGGKRDLSTGRDMEKEFIPLHR